MPITPVTKLPPIKQLHIIRTRKVSDDVVDAVRDSINRIVTLAQLNINVVDLREWGVNEDPKKAYASLDWYQTRFSLDLDHGFGPQVDARGMALVAAHELSWGWKNQFPFKAMIVDRDLNSYIYNMLTGQAKYFDCVYGTGNAFLGFVLSPIRIMHESNLKETSKKLLLSIFKTVVTHEFGHMLGLIRREHNVDFSLGKYWPHCAEEKGPCIMSPGFNLKDRIRQYRREKEVSLELCPDCLEEIKAHAREWKLVANT